jgi:hypothetical protein
MLSSQVETATVSVNPTSSHHRIAALIARLEAPMPDKTARLRKELIALIESGRHLLIGAQALIQYTRPRYTEDTDYAVGQQMFRRVRKWFRDRRETVDYEDAGEMIRSKSLALDIINAHNNPVLLCVLRAESGLPSPEALAACKYAAMTSPTRDRAERIQDFADFSRLVLLEDFDAQKLLGYLATPYDAQRNEVARLIDDIRSGRPVRF